MYTELKFDEIFHYLTFHYVSIRSSMNFDERQSRETSAGDRTSS